MVNETASHDVQPSLSFFEVLSDMSGMSESQNLTRSQSEKQNVMKSKPLLTNPALRQHNKLNFSESTVSTSQPNAVVLKFDPHREYPRNARVIKHSTDKFVLGTDYADMKSLGSITGGSEAKSFSSDYITRPKQTMFPEYSSLNSKSSAPYRKAHSNGRYRKVTLTKLDTMLAHSSEVRRSHEENSLSNDSLSLSLNPLQAKSLDDLFTSTYFEREETRKQLDADHCFTSKVQTPRLVQLDSEAQFKSKDLLNAMIEDVSVMSMSTMNTKGKSLEGGSIGTLKEWKSMYETENNNYDSAALYAEVRYLELKAKERESGYHPTKLKATVCADLMLKLSSATGRYAKIMEPILWELLNCVFLDFPSREGHLKGGEESLKTLYGMHTYFDRHREQLELYDDIHNELEMVQQGLKMSEIVKKFQTVKMVFQTGSFYQRDCAFFLWRGELKRSQQRQKIALRRALLYRWRIWRAYLRQYKTVEMEDMGVELDRKLESLERLQVLLQTHVSPKHSNMSMSGGTPTNRDQQSKFRNLPTVAERSEITETLTSTSVEDAAPAAAADTTTNTNSEASEGKSAKANPELIGTSSKEVKSSPPRNGTSMSDKTVSWDVADPLKMKAPAVKLTAREQKKAEEDRLSLRKSMFDKVNSSIRNTLSSFSLPPPIEISSPNGGESGKHSTPMVGGMMSAISPFGAGGGDFESDSGDGAEQPLTFSMKNGSSKLAVDLIREAAMLANNFVCPQKDQTTQTPDVWMTNINEQPFATPLAGPPMGLMRGQSMRAGLSRQNSLRNSPMVNSGKHGSFSAAAGGGGSGGGGQAPVTGGGSSGKEEPRTPVGGAALAVFKLETVSACQLITYIYEAKIKDGLENLSEINFFECMPLLEYTKNLMLRRYGLKRLADKYFKGLISCVIKEGNLHRRLETFGQMCGLTLEGHKAGHRMTESQCSFYFHSLGMMFGSNLQLLEESMNSFEIDREIVLEVLPDLFPHIEKADSDLSRTIMFEVVDLPRNRPGNELEYRVNFDDVMALIMDYYEEEHKLDTNNSFLYDPIAPPAVEVVKIAKPGSPDQMKALVALTNFVKPSNVSAPTPKKVRVIPTQDLV